MAEEAVARNGLPAESYVLVLYGSAGNVHELVVKRLEFMELKRLLSMACSNYSMHVLEKWDKRLVIYARVRRPRWSRHLCRLEVWWELRRGCVRSENRARREPQPLAKRT